MRTIVAAILIAAVLLALTQPGPAAGQGGRSSSSPPYREREIGQYPNEWGDLVAATTQGQTLILLFRDANKNLRRVRWGASGGIEPGVLVFSRAYKPTK